jgi:Pentapeptide repeats (8 copies)
LGVTCIYLLTQVSPFDLFDLNQDAWVWRDYLVDNPVDEKLGKVLDKMIANSLSQRYQSSEDVLVGLGRKPDRFNTLLNPATFQRFAAAIESIQTPITKQLKLDAQGVLAAYQSGQKTFNEIDISGCDLYKAHIPGLTLSNANCAYINLRGANLAEGKFDRANLSNARFKRAILSRGDFYGANLQNADLSGADLSGANLIEANLNGANLCGTNLKGAKVTEAQINQAKTNIMTIYPNGKRGGLL